jgi:glycosyltransferase involved in cell wall biosynthesis
VTGTVPSLRPFYQGVQVVVAPLRFGSGVKTKVLEAMAAAVPVVGTRFANEGADAAPGVEMIVADEPAAFAEAIVTLLRDDALRRQLGAAGAAFVARRFGAEAVRGRFERAVEEAVARYHTTPSKAGGP